MPANNQYPVYNGVAPSWADISVNVSPDGGSILDLADIQEISTSSAIEVGTVEAGGRVIKRTTGAVKYEASMKLTHEGAVKLCRALAALAPSRGNVKLLRFVHFSVQIQWMPEGSTETFEQRIKGCFYAGKDLSSAKGTDATMVDVKLNPLEIVDVIDGEEVAAL